MQHLEIFIYSGAAVFVVFAHARRNNRWSVL